VNDVADYVERVRAALGDLPPATRDELLEDLPDHLAEVAAEDGGSLVDRLGPPEVYATELRAAAGVPLRARRNLDDRVGEVVRDARARLRAVDVGLGPAIGYPAASDFLRLLRPAWWVLRGYLVAMAIAYASDGEAIGLLPRLGGSTLASVLTLGLCVVASIWLGRLNPRGRWPRIAVGAGGALAVLIALFALVDVDETVRDGRQYEQVYYDNPLNHIEDVYVYDQQGNLLDGVRIFDQNGRQLRLGYERCEPADRYDLGVYPLCPDLQPFQMPGAATPTPTATPAPTPSATG
jgi:hypothetical protein